MRSIFLFSNVLHAWTVESAYYFILKVQFEVSTLCFQRVFVSTSSYHSKIISSLNALFSTFYFILWSLQLYWFPIRFLSDVVYVFYMCSKYQVWWFEVSPVFIIITFVREPPKYPTWYLPICRENNSLLEISIPRS